MLENLRIRKVKTEVDKKLISILGRKINAKITSDMDGIVARIVFLSIISYYGKKGLVRSYNKC